MTMQEAYETMREWMTRPGASRAVLPGSTNQCMYITGGGNKCIVGSLLGPETLNNLYDAYGGIGDLMDNYHVPELEPYMDEDFYCFLENAQRLHDSETSWATGKFNVRAFDRLAKVFGLEVVKPLYVPREWVEQAVLA